MMINYLVEFALVHLVFFSVYKLILSKETQISYLRLYLLASAVLALIVPLINLPNYSPIPNINITDTVSAIILPELIVGEPPVEQAWYAGIHWFTWLLLSVSIIMSFRFIVALIRIIITYLKSEPVIMNGRSIRHLPELKSSFTFFAWIFIDKDSFDDARNIIRHEEAHIKYGHNYDLILLNLLTIPFWWVPSIWLTIRELKQIHEYQADAYSLGTIEYERYLNTLIGHSLKQEGLILTNSFNDTPLTKRLKYMKQLKKKISLWKVYSMVSLMAITFYIFSCQPQNLTDVTEHLENQLENEIFQVVETPASFEGGIEEYYKYISDNLKYPEKALENKVSGKIFIEFVIEKDGSISNTKILRGIGFGCDEEALRVVKDSPAWRPGEQGGHLVRQRLVLPITFRHPEYQEIEKPSDVLEKPHIKNESTKRNEISIDNMPTFPGGMNNFFKYVNENIKYPEEAKKAGVQGKVFIEFMVNSDGSISNAIVRRGIGAGCDEEAKRIIENSPNWQPMVTEGEARSMNMVMPITFKLD